MGARCAWLCWKITSIKIGLRRQNETKQKKKCWVDRNVINKMTQRSSWTVRLHTCSAISNRGRPFQLCHCILLQIVRYFSLFLSPSLCFMHVLVSFGLCKWACANVVVVVAVSVCFVCVQLYVFVNAIIISWRQTASMCLFEKQHSESDKNICSLCFA